MAYRYATNEANKIGKIRNEIQLLDLKVESSGLLDLEIQERLDLLKQKEDLEYIQRLDLLQKEKIKWAIEGDENTKFFHGMINNKFSRSRIKGIFVDRTWVSDPTIITENIFDFHKTKFKNLLVNRITFSNTLFQPLSDQDVSLLDAPFTNEEIKEAVWNCGGGKSPGPDGFTFRFIKHYWEIIRSEFIGMVKRFEIEGFFPKGSNSSFIALVPKCEDPLHIKDFRPISLIGCQYKVIAKLLANRLLQAVSFVVSDVQTTYIKGRQIIEGPLMVNEIISWASKKKKRVFLLKVDFEKAFDSLDWGFLDNVMKQMGFSQKWRKWIKGSPKCVLNYLEQLRRNFFWDDTMENNKIAWIAWKKKKVGNGSIFRFWDDILFSGNCLKTTFARLYSLELNKQCLINERCSLPPTYFKSLYLAWEAQSQSGKEWVSCNYLMVLYNTYCPSPTDDRWDFTLHHSNMYFVSVMRKYIDSRSLLTEGNKTRWNKLVPIKINILAWRLINDRLPTRSNLDSRGIDLHSLLCPVCDDVIESAQHLFLHCNLACNLWSSVFKWWKVDNVPNTILDLITWVDSANLPDVAKNILDGVILTTVWVIWRYRNKICFDEKPPRKDTLMDDIKTFHISLIG
ncbi:RNA-directed DNA polymerase, eukaryota [Tanacetum coccineum]